jgi:hypothetical protein
MRQIVLVVLEQGIEISDEVIRDVEQWRKLPVMDFFCPTTRHTV